MTNLQILQQTFATRKVKDLKAAASLRNSSFMRGWRSATECQFLCAPQCACQDAAIHRPQDTSVSRGLGLQHQAVLACKSHKVAFLEVTHFLGMLESAVAWSFVRSAFKDWKDLKGSQQRALIVTVLGATITAGLAYYQGSVSMQSFISLTLSVALALFMDRIARYKFENNSEVDLQKLVQKDNTISHIGDSEEGVNWFIRNASEAISVTNTVINRSEHRQNPHHREITPIFLRRAVKMINRGCIWTDICLSSEHHELLDFAKRLRPAAQKNYEVKVIHPNAPVVQCIIMRFRDNHKEVLFGWGFKGTSKSLVFHSSNQETAEYFDLYTNLLLISPSPPLVERTRNDFTTAGSAPSPSP